MNDLKMAIDLLWVRPGKIGGVESYIRNLLDAFIEFKGNYKIFLIVSKDNATTFERYFSDERFEAIRCDVYSSNVSKRIFWQIRNLEKTLKSHSLNMCFEPHNYIPLFGTTRNIKYVATLNDLQPAHYPQNFDFKRRNWYKINWINTVHKARRVIGISDFVRNDIAKMFPKYADKVVRIYIPINMDLTDLVPKSQIENKYGVKAGEYFFTVSSLMPHKNLITIIKAISILKKQGQNCKLVISGVGGKLKGEFEKQIDALNLRENIVLSGFIQNDERNTLYKYCKAFLFPSVFEGFGMPLIEAAMFGCRVITTRMSCIEEVTQGCAEYVDDPYCVDEWVNRIQNNCSCDTKKYDFDVYAPMNVAKQYYKLFKAIYQE